MDDVSSVKINPAFDGREYGTVGLTVSASIADCQLAICFF
jgi:hypothetical protein